MSGGVQPGVVSWCALCHWIRFRIIGSPLASRGHGTAFATALKSASSSSGQTNRHSNWLPTSAPCEHWV